MIKKISLLLLLSLITACESAPSSQVQAMQKKDKQLTCKEVLLEMNEAQFYQKMAQKNKSPNLKNILMPLGYISTYMSAEDAIQTASARVEYLDKIYNIMDCDAQKSGFQSQSSNYAPVPNYPPVAYPADPRAQQMPRLAPASAPNYHYQELQQGAPEGEPRMY